MNLLILSYSAAQDAANLELFCSDAVDNSFNDHVLVRITAIFFILPIMQNHVSLALWSLSERGVRAFQILV